MTTLRHHAPHAAAIPGLLWAAGLVAMVAGTAGAAWPLALGWAAAGLLPALAWRALAQSPKARAGACGVARARARRADLDRGLFLVPAALAGVAVSALQFDEYS